MFIHKNLCRSLRFVLMTIASLTLSFGAMWAQDIKVTGQVTDKAGEPLVGVYVYVQGTQTGTTTDVDGKYAISAPGTGTLVFSSMGFTEAKVAINNRSTVNVTMTDDAVLLSDVVVVGFGSQKKENLTGAVASVNTKQALEGRAISDVGRGLQGMTPGLNVRIGSNEVGSDPLLRIRGQVGSYQGGSSPLILLDNVEIPSINVINPDDVESISILKDAASASIYGAKGAFGVILIQSKKGAQSDNIEVSYSGNVAFQNIVPSKGIADVDALRYTVEAAERVGTFTPVGAFWLIDRAGYNAAVAWKEKYSNLDYNSPMTYGRDWYLDGSNRKIGVRTYDPFDYLIRKNAPSQNHNLSVAGNKGNTTFNISLGYLGQSGMMKCTDFDKYTRYNTNVRISTKINDYIKVRTGVMYTNSAKDWAFATNSTTADPWYYVYRWGPTYPQVPVDEYGNNVRSAAYELSTAHKAQIAKSYTSINVGGTITPLKNWNIDFDYTYANNNSQETNPGITYMAGDSWTTPVNYKDANGNIPEVTNEWAEYNGLGATLPAKMLKVGSYTNSYNSYYQDSYTSKRQTWNVTSKYDLNIADTHLFNFMIGLNSVDYKYTGVWGKRMDLMDINNPQFSLATGTQTVGGSNSWNSVFGVFGRINYNLKERYLLEANVRYDGSSKFPTSMKWRWFPSFSAGWRVTEEPWMKNVKNVLSSLKIRGSWGSIGDQTVSSSLYIPTMSSMTSYFIHNGLQDTPYATPGLVASDITWQNIQTLDIGADMSLFNRVNITFDWYKRDTKDMIVGAEGLSYNIGANAPQGNYGSLSTKGWEFSINYGHIFSNGLSLSATASIADAKTTITKFGSGKTCSSWYNGKTYGEIWGYKVDRLFQKDDFAYDANGELINVTATDGYTVYQFADGKNYATQGKLNSGSLIFGPGDVKFKDLNGDGVINNGSNLIDDHGDLAVIGNTTPRYEYSFRIDLGYKGFDFAVFAQGVGKRDMVGSSPLTLPGFNSSDGAMPQTFAGDFWIEGENEDAFYPRAANCSGSRIFNMATNDRYLLNMAYFRIKNITLGYTLPRNISKKVYMNKVRVYASLENFFTFDHLRGLPIDVEEVAGYSYLNSSNYNLGRAGVGTPAFRTASFGLQITF